MSILSFVRNMYSFWGPLIPKSYLRKFMFVWLYAVASYSIQRTEPILAKFSQQIYFGTSYMHNKSIDKFYLGITSICHKFVFKKKRL